MPGSACSKTADQPSLAALTLPSHQGLLGGVALLQRDVAVRQSVGRDSRLFVALLLCGTLPIAPYLSMGPPTAPDRNTEEQPGVDDPAEGAQIRLQRRLLGVPLGLSWPGLPFAADS